MSLVQELTTMVREQKDRITELTKSRKEAIAELKVCWIQRPVYSILYHYWWDILPESSTRAAANLFWAQLVICKGPPSTT